MIRRSGFSAIAAVSALVPASVLQFGSRNLERIAERGRLLTPDRGPGLGDIEAHGDRDEDHFLAFDPAEIIGAAHLIEAGVFSVRRRVPERPV